MNFIVRRKLKNPYFRASTGYFERRNRQNLPKIGRAGKTFLACPLQRLNGDSGDFTTLDYSQGLAFALNNAALLRRPKTEKSDLQRKATANI